LGKQQVALDFWRGLRLDHPGTQSGTRTGRSIVTDDTFEKFTEQLANKIRDAVASRVAEVLSSAGLLEALTPAQPSAGPSAEAAGRKDSGQKICSFAGCHLPARARGLCSKHYQRQRYAEKKGQEDIETGASGSRQNPKPTAKRGGGVCSWDGCDEPNYARGLCSKHFMQWVRTKKAKQAPDKGTTDSAADRPSGHSR
jgi:hypothetical protein